MSNLYADKKSLDDAMQRILIAIRLVKDQEGRKVMLTVPQEESRAGTGDSDINPLLGPDMEKVRDVILDAMRALTRHHILPPAADHDLG